MTKNFIVKKRVKRTNRGYCFSHPRFPIESALDMNSTSQTGEGFRKEKRTRFHISFGAVNVKSFTEIGDID